MRRENENLLHPLQSMRKAQMVVYLDPRHVDITSCSAVMDHVRGRLLYATLSSFVKGGKPHRIVNGRPEDLPGIVRVRLGEEYTSINGFLIVLDEDALVWHDVTVPELAHRIADAHSEVYVLPTWTPLGQSGGTCFVFHLHISWTVHHCTTAGNPAMHGSGHLVLATTLGACSFTTDMALCC